MRVSDDARPGGEAYNNDRTVAVEWKDGHQSNFPLIWLRDHCKSEASQHHRQVIVSLRRFSRRIA